MKTVTLYTDGACSGNPGPGGWGAILEYKGAFRRRRKHHQQPHGADGGDQRPSGAEGKLYRGAVF